MYQMFLNLLGTQLRIVLSASCLSYKATKLGGHPDHKNPGPVWKQVWHYKDPSLLKCHKHCAYVLTSTPLQHHTIYIHANAQIQFTQACYTNVRNILVVL